MESQTKLNVCRICTNSVNNTLYTAREMMFGFRDEFLYFQCCACGCLQIADFPKDISKYYPEDYYSFDAFNGKKFKGILGKIVLRKYAALVNGRGILDRVIRSFSGNKVYNIFENLDVSKNTRILDVGCGNGRSFLYPLAELGFKNLLGCDPFLQSTIDYDNGLQIKNLNLFEMEGSWDIITYHHSFEHVPNPLEHLQKVSELLKPNGVCIIRIPTVTSFAWKHYGVNWVQLDAPRHYFLHSVESMSDLGKKVGLEMYKTLYDSTHFQFTASEKYIKDIPLHTPRQKGVIGYIQSKIKQRNYSNKAKELNRAKKGDQAAFFFRKK